MSVGVPGLAKPHPEKYSVHTELWRMRKIVFEYCEELPGWTPPLARNPMRTISSFWVVTFPGGLQDLPLEEVGSR
jgi:hypothetical protein